MCSTDFSYLLHHEITTDILQTIPDAELPTLRDKFKQNWPYAIQAYFFIDQLINWKFKKPKLQVRITCPEGKWQDGTFVAIVTEYTYQIYFFTLESTCERLARGLKETKLIEWKKGPYICAIHEDQDKAIMKALLEIDGEIEFDIESTCWWLPKEMARNIEIKISQNVSVHPLQPNHAKIINSLWPHSFPGSENYLANMIAMNGGYGVFTSTPNPILCSWVTTNDFGAVAILQTINEYKRNGFAALLVKFLVKKAAENNCNSITYIVRKNIISQSLFKSLGFIFNNNVRWVQFKQFENRFIKARL